MPPRRPTRRHRPNNKNINLKQDDKNDFPIKGISANYLLNLIDYLPLNEDLIMSLLTVMDLNQRIDLINFVFDNIDEPEQNPRGYSRRDITRNSLLDQANVVYNLQSDFFEVLTGRENRTVLPLFTEYIKNQFTEIYPSQDNINIIVQDKLSEISNLFYLDEIDVEVLAFLFCTYSTNLSIISSLFNDILYQEVFEFISIALNKPITSIRTSLNSTGKLFQTGIIETIDTQRGDFFLLDDSIEDFMSGLTDISFIQKFVKHDKDEVIPLKNFRIQEDKQLLQNFIKTDSACNILIYGIAGTGKTEFVRSIIRDSGKDIYFLQSGDDKNSRGRRSSSENKILALQIGSNTVDPKRGVLIVDEADYILNTKRSFFGPPAPREKGWLNSFLEETKLTIIWISNKTVEMEESTQRRFAYSVKFEKHTAEDREMIFNNILSKHPLKDDIPSSLVKSLSKDYNVNAGTIASALESTKILKDNSNGSDHNTEETLRKIIESHEILIEGKKPDTSQEDSVTTLYDPTVLNTDIDIQKVIFTTKQFSKKLNENLPDKIQMNLLLWGMPGTGKTEFVKYLGKSLNKKVIVKRSSDLVSKWVGETEKNISKAFKEAERDKSILFIDEADSFFTARENARASWEVSRTNEFLTQMENFKGIFVASTNLLPNLDRASMRRFNWKVEFKPLAMDKRLKLYKKYFAHSSRQLTKAHKEAVKNLNGLTPGDLRAVHHNTIYFEAEDLSHDFIISELQKEIKYKESENLIKVGF